MGQRVKELAAEPNALNSSLQIHTVGSSNSHELSPDLSMHTLTQMSMYGSILK